MPDVRVKHTYVCFTCNKVTELAILMHNSAMSSIQRSCGSFAQYAMRLEDGKVVIP